jgi:hypothetical protein
MVIILIHRITKSRYVERILCKLREDVLAISLESTYLMYVTVSNISSCYVYPALSHNKYIIQIHGNSYACKLLLLEWTHLLTVIHKSIRKVIYFRGCTIKTCNFHHIILTFILIWLKQYQSQQLCSLRRWSATAHLLRLWVRIPPGAWMCVSSECCVLSGRGLCNKLITHPEQSYWLWCVVVCDLETLWVRRTWPPLGSSAKKKKKVHTV